MNEVIAGKGEVCASNAPPDRAGRLSQSCATHTVHAFGAGTIRPAETVPFSEIRGSAMDCGANSHEFPVRTKPRFSRTFFAVASLQNDSRQAPP